MRRGDIAKRVVAIGTGLAVASLALTVDNAIRVRRPEPTDVPDAEPLTVLIPMRDEVAVAERCVRGVLAAADRWPGTVRVVVLDDGSTDGTGAVLAALAQRDARLEIIDGAPLPPGWLGKPWACHQLAESAFSGLVGPDSAGSEPARSGGVFVFVDADVVVEPCAFTSSVALLRRTGLDLLSPYPRQIAVGIGERLVQPLLQWSWLSTLPLGIAERSPRPSLSAANGQLIVVDAQTYRRAGGHAAVRDEVLEDIALLRAVKRAGGHGVAADGSRIATCRMYEGWRAVRAGYGKSLWNAFGSAPGSLAVMALLSLMYVVPFLAALTGSRTGAVGYVAGVASRVIAARSTGGRAWPDALVHPASMVTFAALTVDSAIARRRGRLQWKGRSIEVNA